jgi:hypothetical protein
MYKSKTLNLDIHRRSTKEVIYDYDTFGDKFKQIENKVLGGSDGEPVFALTTTRFSHDSDITLVAENHLPKRINTTKTGVDYVTVIECTRDGIKED